MKSFCALARATIVLCLLSLTAFDATAACPTRTELLVFLAREVPTAKVRVFPKEEARLLLAALAAATRSQAPEADELLMVELTAESPVVKIVLIKSGCVSRIGTFERRIMSRALIELSKTGA